VSINKLGKNSNNNSMKNQIKEKEP